MLKKLLRLSHSANLNENSGSGPDNTCIRKGTYSTIASLLKKRKHHNLTDGNNSKPPLLPRPWNDSQGNNSDTVFKQTFYAAPLIDNLSLVPESVNIVLATDSTSPQVIDEEFLSSSDLSSSPLTPFEHVKLLNLKNDESVRNRSKTRNKKQAGKHTSSYGHWRRTNLDTTRKGIHRRFYYFLSAIVLGLLCCNMKYIIQNLVAKKNYQNWMTDSIMSRMDPQFKQENISKAHLISRINNSTMPRNNTSNEKTDIMRDPKTITSADFFLNNDGSQNQEALEVPYELKNILHELNNIIIEEGSQFANDNVGNMQETYSSKQDSMITNVESTLSLLPIIHCNLQLQYTRKQLPLHEHDNRNREYCDMRNPYSIQAENGCLDRHD